VSKTRKPESIEALFARHGPSYRWFATATVMMGTIATLLTATIINVALPDIMGAFGMGQDKAQLLATGFLAAMTGTMLLNAWMVETFGKRFTYTVSLSSFAIASVLGGIAPNEGVLVISRVLQGAAAGVLQPLAMQIVFEVFPSDRRGTAMGIFGIGVVLAPALGPALGGLMVDTFSWRYVFFLAVPFCAIGLAMAPFFLPGPDLTRQRRRFDWIGFGLLSVFLVTLLSGLSDAPRYGWESHLIVSLLSAAFLSGIAFILWELTTPAPMLNLKLFRNRIYAAGSLVSFTFGAGIYGSTFLLPLFVQTIQGYTPTKSGLLLMPAGLMLAVIFPIAGRLSDRTPAYVSLLFGLSVFAAASFLMGGVDANTSFWTLASWIVLGRIGLGFMMPSLSAGALKALPPEMLAQGSGAMNFTRQLGGAFGVNFLSIFLTQRTQLYASGFADAQRAGQGATAEVLQQVAALLAQAGVPPDLLQTGAVSYLARMIYAQGAVMGYRDCFVAAGFIFLAALIPAWLMREGRRSLVRLSTAE